METIIVKGWKYCDTAKGRLMVVEINGNRQATLAPWEKKEQAFIENEVGELGNFQGEIKVDGEYTNIKNIDFDSAEKIGTGAPVEKVEKGRFEPTKTAPNPQRVGLYIKLAVEMTNTNPMLGKTTEENLCENVQEIKKLEDFVIGLLG